MKKASRTGTCPFCGERHRRDYRCEAEYESWEIDYELREREDAELLVAHYEAVAEWVGTSPHVAHRLGDAYVRCGQPEKAIELLTELHRRHPSNQDVQYVILDALIAMGRDETDFDWAARVRVYTLGPSVLDRCFVYLEPKRHPLSVYQLHCELALDAYCAFTPEALLEAVKADPRFVVEANDFWSPEIRVRGVSGGEAKAPDPNDGVAADDRESQP